MSKIRNSRIELLRIISMLCIIAYHSTRTFDAFFTDISLFNKFVEISLSIWGPLGVHLFVIISAWHLCDQQFKSKKFFGIIFEYITYTFLFICLDAFINHSSFIIVFKDFIANLIGRFSGSSGYLFITAYILMYFVSPLLNKIIKYKNFDKVLLVLSFVPVYCNFYGRGGAICSFTMFSYIYLLTAYIKKINFSFKHPCLISSLIIVLLIFTNCIQNIMFVDGIFPDKVYKVIGNYENGSFLITILSYSIFLNNINKKVYTSKFINYVASFSLAVYCFHESAIYNVTDNVAEFSIKLLPINNNNFIFVFILLPIIIYLMTIIVEEIRIFLLQKPFNKIMEKYIPTDRIDSWMNSI